MGLQLAHRPPQRLPPPGGYPPVDLLLVKAQPHERVRRGGQRLSGPRSFPDHRDQLLAGVSIALARAERLGCPCPVEIQKAASTLSRCEDSAANSSPNIASGIARGGCCGTALR